MKTFRIYFKNEKTTKNQEKFLEVQSKSLEVLRKRAARLTEGSYSVWPDGRAFTFEESLKMDLRAQREAGIKTLFHPSTILRIEEV